MKLNENCSIDPKAIEAMMRYRAEKEICTYVHEELMKEFGQAPSIEELIKHFSGELADIPGFTVEQKLCAVFLMVKFNILQGIAVCELANAKAAMESAECEEGCDASMEHDDNGALHG